MRHGWIKHDGGDRVCVIALGWACGPALVRRLGTPDGPDILALFDYGDLDFSRDSRQVGELILPYRHRSLVAWSFGVWAAGRLFAGPLFDRAIAINGTPYPAHERYGIGQRRLSITIRGLRSAGLEEFNRKAYGPWERLAAEAQKGRDLAGHIAELETLARLSAEPYEPCIRWDEALIGTGDEIFPPSNMEAYWQSKGKAVPLLHFPFGEDEVKRTIFETR